MGDYGKKKSHSEDQGSLVTDVRPRKNKVKKRKLNSKKQKRSENVGQVLVFGAFIGSFVWDMIPEQREIVETYANLDDCKNAVRFSDQQCEKSYQEALKIHEKSAPRYNNSSLCRQEFSAKCEKRQDGYSTFWSPFMAGFLVSEILKDNRSTYYHSPYYRRYGESRGLYTWTGDSIYYKRSNARITHVLSRKAMDATPKTARVMTRTSVVSRGGFGSQAVSSRGG